ncbi:MAG: STAS domain-containing protein [Verrucomicrobia bacterium]|nr:STAS domain-containing protein [Verrucomicrobiota bacterium]
MIQFQEQDGRLICSFTGPLDTAVCQRMEAELMAKVDAARLPVVFDLNGVDFIGSMFLRLCLMVIKNVQANNFRLMNMKPPVKKVFKIAGFDQCLDPGSAGPAT